jgi:hypothetical protein
MGRLRTSQDAFVIDIRLGRSRRWRPKARNQSTLRPKARNESTQRPEVYESGRRFSGRRLMEVAEGL